ncbi:sensor histidine kinase [Furfurilactobacillus cerevisiae]|uniref:sensor histidine kinase n=1 Tax=Furfurilactobacillus rossiae TaxID=231049 RepID=UPI003B985AF2
MTFLRRYILFPSRFGFYPYFWLIFLSYPIAIGFAETGIRRVLTLFFLAIFFLCYRNSYEITKLLPWSIAGQLIVCVYMMLVENYMALFIFIAWVVGSLPFTKRVRWRYLTAYYGTFTASVIAAVTKLVAVTPHFQLTDRLDLLVLLAFAYGSPIAAMSVMRTADKSRAIQQTNERLENVIRQNERNRIAQDLHDTLGQSFSMITIKTELARKLLKVAPEKVDEQLNDVENASRDNLQLVRSIVNDLRQLNIAEVIINQNRNLQDANVTLLTINESISNTWPRQIQITLGAVIQEAITNIIRHAHADHCWLTFGQQANLLTISIRDNGKGIHKPRENSSGISGMAKRMETINGTLDVASSSEGTTLTISCPKPKTNKEKELQS